MRLFLTFLIIPFLSFSQNWDLLTPLKTNKSVTDIEAIDGNTYYLLQKSNSNDILKTTDHGDTWERPFTTSDSTWDIHMFDENNGLVSTNLSVYFTNDGFQNISLAQNLAFSVYKFSFVNASVGYGVGNNGKIVKTTDGGMTWTTQNSTLSNSSSNGLLSVYFVNENVGYACGLSSKILKTIDGGNTWTAATVGSSGWLDIFFYDEMNGVVVGNNQDLKYTTDGGITWIDSNYQTTNALYEIRNVNNTLVVCGSNGIILKSTDNGINWTEEVLNSSKNLLSIDFSGTNLLVSGEAITYNSTDNGQSWNLTDEGVRPANLVAVDFANNLNGVTVGRNSTANSNNLIFTTTDGGITWARTKSLTSSSAAFNAVHLLPDGNGIVNRSSSSSSGQYFLTNDFGVTWQTRTPIGNLASSACWMRNANAYTLGGSEIYNTLNNGSNWDSFDSLNITAFYFPSDNIGYAIGQRIYKTVDGGMNWNEITEPQQNQNYKQIQFLTDDIGFVSSTNAGVFKTVDGGMSWTSFTNITGSIKFLFLSELSIFNIQGGNLVLYTNDGGVTWDNLAENNTVSTNLSNASILDGKIIGIGNNSDIYSLSIPTFSSLLSIEEKTEDKFIIYPNPASEVITIKNKASNIISDLELVTINGESVFKKENTNYAAELTLNISNLKAGIYFLKINFKGAIITKKIVKY